MNSKVSIPLSGQLVCNKETYPEMSKEIRESQSPYRVNWFVIDQWVDNNTGQKRVSIPLSGQLVCN